MNIKVCKTAICKYICMITAKNKRNTSKLESIEAFSDFQAEVSFNAADAAAETADWDYSCGTDSVLSISRAFR